MEILETSIPEELTDNSPWGDPPPRKFEDEELDILAFELWQRASRQDAGAAEDCSGEEEVVGCHASCL